MTAPVAPAIVLAAHRRPRELERLGRLVVAADIAAGTPLVVSIDGGAEEQSDVRSVADAIDWPHGPVDIIEHDNLGLVEHFHRCGDLTDRYGAVVLLEDDLIVGPSFHRWAVAALRHAHNDDRIAGVSLACPFFDGYRHLPFEPILDGSDAIFAQVPWYDGMAWSSAMWRRYRDETIDPSTPVHALLNTLDDDEWFPDALRYLVQTGRYYLLPRHAHATNSGAAGAHFDTATDYFQVPLSLRGPLDWRLLPLNDSLAVYDDHLEIAASALQRLVPNLAAYDLTVDLLATRDVDHMTTQHVLTTRSVESAIDTWGASLHPLIANVALDYAGEAIRLAELSAVVESESSERDACETLTRHATRGRNVSGGEAVRHLATVVRKRIRRDR